MKKLFVMLLIVSVSLAVNLFSQDLALKGGTVLTITQGVIPNGTVLIQNGKITAIGEEITIPPGVRVIDCIGKFVMPGIIDSHTHIALSSGDINEATDPVTS